MAEVETRVELGGTGDVAASLEPLRRWDDDLMDRWDGRVLARTARISGRSHPIAIAIGPGREARVRHRSSLPAGTVERLVSSMVIDAPAALAETAARDRAVASLLERAPAVRPVRVFDTFGLLVRAITTQQVNLSFATVVRRRLVELLGTRHRIGDRHVWSIPPERLADAAPARLRELQLSTRKAEYLIGSARLVANGTLDLDALADLGDEKVVERIVAVRGFGRWTAEWFLVRGLGRPRVVAGDLAVRKAVGALYGEPGPPTEARTRELTEHWGDAAAVLQMLALEDLYG